MCLGLAGILFDSAASAQPRGPLRDVIRTLRSEAQEAAQRGRVLQEDPDFAERYVGEIDLDAVQQAITRSQHRDTFIDSYIRWQLTSFDVSLPELNDRDFSRFVQQLPRMVENPRAESRRVAFFENVAKSEQFRDGDFAELQRMSAQLDDETDAAESRNRPAAELRRWLRAQTDEHGWTQRSIELAIEECVATVQAGWPPRAIKTEITRRMTEAAKDPSLDQATRRRIIVPLQRIAGLERRSVNTITFMGDSSVNVTFSRPAIHRRDVENWHDRLFGIERNDETNDGGE